MAADGPLSNAAKKQETAYVPYRATKLWNEAIGIFRDGMSVGRRRRGLKSYDSCFQASEAASWLHQRLQENNNFGPQVSRSQTVQLLQKFHKARLFEDVRGMKHDKDGFTDGGRLFRFVAATPSKPLISRSLSRTPLATRTINSDSALPRLAQPLTDKKSQPMAAPNTAGLPRKHVRVLPVRSQSCRGERDTEVTVRSTHRAKVTDRSLKVTAKVVPEVKLTDAEIEGIWKEALLDSIKQILTLQKIGDVMDPDVVNARHVIHNMTQVNKNGLVTNIDKRDQLPHWIISAMRCLAYWPERVEENLPDYPGFEKDVFKVIKDYFWEQEEPLVTFPLYEAFLSVMVYADSIGKPPSRPPRSPLSPPSPPHAPRYPPGPPTDPQGASPTHSLPSSTSVENLILNMTTEALGPDDIMVITDPDVTVLPGGPRAPRRARAGSLPAPRPASLPGARLETSFGVDTDEPQTRVYHKASEDRGYHSNSQESDECEAGYRDDGRRPYSLCGATSTDTVFMDVAPDNHGPLRARSLSSVTTETTEPWARVDHKPPVYPALYPATTTYPTVTVEAPPPYCSRPPPYRPPPSYQRPPAYPPPRSDPPALDGSLVDVSRSLPSLGPPSVMAAAESYRHAISASTPGGANTTPARMYPLTRSHSSPSVLTPLSRPRVYEVLQSCCLLLPPQNRRKLHLLLRFMNKAANNTQLSIDPAYSMQELVLRTFTRCILRSEDDIDHELLTQQIVTFMAEGYTEIMRVPETLGDEVEERITARERQTVWDSDDSLVAGDDADSDTALSDADGDVTMVTPVFCQQVTAADYERQKMSASQRALHTLLDDIIRDDRMKPGDKKRHLQNFQKSHPQIYARRFSTNQTTTTKKTRTKQPLLSRPLFKLKSLRL